MHETTPYGDTGILGFPRPAFSLTALERDDDELDEEPEDDLDDDDDHPREGLLEAAGGAKKKKKKKKPEHKPPPGPVPSIPRAAAMRAFLYVPSIDLARYSLSEMGITDVMVGIGSNLLWDPNAEGALRDEIGRLRGLSQSLPLTVFYWCFGNLGGPAAQAPWKVSEPVWQTFLSRVRLISSLGVKGQCMDCEDEGRVARRSSHTVNPPCEVTNPWWPRAQVAGVSVDMVRRGREYGAAVGAAECGIYAIYYLQESTVGVNGNCTPTRIPAYSWWDFVNGLGRPWSLFSGDTYYDHTPEAVRGMWGRMTTGEILRLAPANMAFVPGTWLESAAAAEGPERLGLINAAQETTNRHWIYQDPGYLAVNGAQRTIIRDNLR